MLWLGGVLLSVFGFWLGKIVSQSERAIEQKKAVFEKFLLSCPTANDAYRLTPEQLETELGITVEKQLGLLALYAGPKVLSACANYIFALTAASEALDQNSEPMAAEFQKAAKCYNRMIFEMRRDALGWSVFGVSGEPDNGELLTTKPPES